MKNIRSLWNGSMAIISIGGWIAFAVILAPTVLSSFMAFKNYHDDYYKKNVAIIEHDRIATAPQNCPIYFAHKAEKAYGSVLSEWTWCEKFPQYAN